MNRILNFILHHILNRIPNLIPNHTPNHTPDRASNRLPQRITRPISPSLRHAASALLGATLFVFSSTVSAVEYPIGRPQQVAGMQIAAVYLQPVVMEPEGMMRDAKDSDVHLEADISALASNANGIPEGAWVPYLVVAFEVSKKGSNEIVKGDMMPMVANDGPHYGDNVKLSGPGQYRLKLTISPPSANPHAHFGRHIDRQTGVAPWFKPFSVEYDFTFAGIGKKGGY